jgi:pyridinium-3,5-biscarboxylic acid mononucleotide sulfurtransferase
MSTPLDVRLDGRLAELAGAVGATLPDGRLGVAFSAGVDSTVLLALAARTLGAGRVVAVTGDSPSLARRELGEARELAALIAVELVEVPTAEGSSPDYRRNGLDRCFHCKDTLFRTIDDTLLDRYGLDAVAYGETADDVERDDRPGSTAATRHGVLRPLAAAGLRKPDIRALAAALGLPNAAKPAAPCLASRIPHGTEVTPAKLRQIEQAEAALHELGLPDLRVRHHGAVARLEVPVERLAEVATDPLRTRVLAGVRAAGFAMVALDLGGLRSGELFQIARQAPQNR